LLGQKEAALISFFELLELNPNDNQGIRDQAGLICLELDKFSQYEELYRQFEDDDTAFHLFNYCLYLFLQQGNTEVSREALTKARHYNKHVIHLMNNKKPLPPLPEMFGFGDKNEAIYYCTLAKPVWQGKSGAIDWMALIFQNRYRLE
jgi:tetratricopeptide (TPR) repeat protein